MVYRIIYSAIIKEDLQKLPPPVSRRIIEKIGNLLAQDPQGLGKPLTGAFKGLWRYRVGDYRIIYRIIMDQIIVVVLRAGHRKDIYRKRISN